jgi:hypothetical protein
MASKETMFIKPAHDRMIRYPDGYGALSRQLLPTGGAYVPANARYWVRKLRLGDCVICEAPKTKSEAKPKPEPKPKAAPKVAAKKSATKSATKKEA